MSRFPPRVLILITLALLVALTGGVVVATKRPLPDAVEINHTTHPTIGNPNAKIHLVLFEEPKCINCSRFTNEVFPKIKQEYIDTNKATFTVIIVSFLPGSMPAATALLCAYHADPMYPNSRLFFDYLDYMYEHQPPESSDWATVDELIMMAKATSPAINPNQLKKCIDQEAYIAKVRKNTELGRQVMGGSLATPTLFVNGVQARSLSFSHIQELIDEVSK